AFVVATDPRRQQPLLVLLYVTALCDQAQRAIELGLAFGGSLIFALELDDPPRKLLVSQVVDLHRLLETQPSVGFHEPYGFGDEGVDGGRRALLRPGAGCRAGSTLRAEGEGRPRAA